METDADETKDEGHIDEDVVLESRSTTNESPPENADERARDDGASTASRNVEDCAVESVMEVMIEEMYAISLGELP